VVAVMGLEDAILPMVQRIARRGDTADNLRSARRSVWSCMEQIAKRRS
jgi:hypothetical protein